MKTKTEIEEQIRKIERGYKHILKGSLATLDVDAPRAILQIQAESMLSSLYWVLGKKFKSKLKGVNI